MMELIFGAVLWCLIWYGLGKKHGYEDAKKEAEETKK
jgi:hypothetical protein